MRILMIAINDPAGTAIEFTKAINKHTEHTCRLITKEIRYNFMFEKDLHLPWLDQDGWDEVADLLRTSDVFHFHMTADEHIELGTLKPVDYMNGKIIVHHHHGHPDFRGNPEKYRRKYKALGRRNLLVSTPDLLKLMPEARWQPNLVPVHDPLYTPLEDKPEVPVIICHSPTRKDLKNTADFIQAVDEVKLEAKAPIELRLIENTPHKECLRLKREAHVLFDHLQGYYGVSSLEGLSQGLCVVAGLDEWNQKHIKAFTGAEKLPWVIAGYDTIFPVLKEVIDAGELKHHASYSRSFMLQHWAEQRVVERLLSNVNGC